MHKMVMEQWIRYERPLTLGVDCQMYNATDFNTHSHKKKHLSTIKHL